jgi:hypothetical protein
MSLLYYYGWANYLNYVKFCEKNGTTPDKAVFLFPGNASHHGKNHNLYTKKGGGGLAAFSGELGDKGLPVLSLPTTGMGKWATDTIIKQTVQGAVDDLWKAVGAGYDLVLPVRDHENKKYFDSPLETTVSEYDDKLEMMIEKPVEPSFWGAIEKTPNKPLAKFYINQLNILAQFMAVKGTEKEATFLSELGKNQLNLVAAYRKGQQMQSNDPWLQNPGSTKTQTLPPKKPAALQTAASTQKQPETILTGESMTNPDSQPSTSAPSSVEELEISSIRKRAILKLLTLFNINDCQEEGIFRVSPSESEKQAKIRELLKENFAALSDKDEPNLKAGVLKQLIRDLRDIEKLPLVSDPIRDKLLKANEVKSHEDKLEGIKSAIGDLPSEDKLILNNLLKLCTDITKQPKSKMNATNLATVIAPNFIKANPTDLLASFQFNDVFQFMIENYEHLAPSLAITEVYKADTTTHKSPEPSLEQTLFPSLKKEIEEKTWDVGLFGGVTVDIGNDKKVVMPHHVAELYAICQRAKPDTFKQDVADAKAVIQQRDVPKGVFDWIKSILKALDVFHLFSRKESTETFYKDKLKLFAPGTDSEQSPVVSSEIKAPK